MSRLQMGREIEKGYLLRLAKYKSNVYHNVQGHLPGSFSDRDVHHECTGGVEAPKISKEKAATATLNALHLTL